MEKFWNAGWYVDKSNEFLELRLERKPYALVFIIAATIFFIVCVTRFIIGRHLGLVLLCVAIAMLVAGCVWYRIAYLSQEELKKRGFFDDKKRR